MKAWWSETRLNGQPREPGTFVRFIDPEDGTHIIAVQGRTEDEVLQKIERQFTNSQAAMFEARRAAQPNPATPNAPMVVVDSFKLSPDQLMQYTEDLKNPAKSAEASRMLQAHADGVDPRKKALEFMKSMALAWEKTHPEFYAHKGNRSQMGYRIGMKTNGNLLLVTDALLTECYQELLAEGALFEAPEEYETVPDMEPGQTIPPPTPSLLPVESQVQRIERPRRFATGARSSTFRAPQTAPPRTLKYTEDQLLRMPMTKREELLRANGGKGDPDYMAACEQYWPSKQAARA